MLLFCLFSVALRPNVGHGLLILDVSRSQKRRTTVGRTPLDEWSAHRRDLYLTTHNTHNRQTSMPPVGFEPTISAGERPQTYALDRAATGTGKHFTLSREIKGDCFKMCEKWINKGVTDVAYVNLQKYFLLFEVSHTYCSCRQEFILFLGSGLSHVLRNTFY